MSSVQTPGPDAERGGRATPRRTAVIIAASGVTAALAFGAVAVSASATPPAPPTRSSSPQDGRAPDEPATKGPPLRIPAPAVGPIRNEQNETGRAKKAASVVVDAMNQMGNRGDGTSAGIESITTNFVLGELQSYAQQQRDLGYRQVGQAQVTSVKASAVKLKGPKPSMNVTVCVDVAGIDVLDAAGKSLKRSLYNPGRPVKHVYGAHFVDNVWKIATHEIPDTQDCGAGS